VIALQRAYRPRLRPRAADAPVQGLFGGMDFFDPGIVP